MKSLAGIAGLFQEILPHLPNKIRTNLANKKKQVLSKDSCPPRFQLGTTPPQRSPPKRRKYNKNLRFEEFLRVLFQFIRREIRSSWHKKRNSCFKDRAKFDFTPQQFHRWFQNVSLRTLQRYFLRAWDEGYIQLHSTKTHKRWGTTMRFFFSKELMEKLIREFKSRCYQAIDFLKSVVLPEEKKNKKGIFSRIGEISGTDPPKIQINGKIFFFDDLKKIL